MHRFFRAADVSALQAKQFSSEHLPEIALSPHDATRCLVRNDVDYLPIDAIAGRIATTPFVVYPPGIATIVPGERLTERAQPMIDYLKMFEASFNAFPGFEVEIQGVYREVDDVRPCPAPYLRGLRIGQSRRRSQCRRRRTSRRSCIRPSRDDDVEAMLAIYRHHIRRGIEAGVDDNGMPQPDDLRDRRKNLRSRRFPHLVATRGGEVVGYAYVVLFRKRPAYRYTVKHSIYVHHDHHRPRHRTAAHAGADRRLRGGRLPADDRLYRCRQCRFACACTRQFGFARVGLLPGRRLSLRALGRQRHGAALARRRINGAATARAPLVQAMNRLAACSQRSVSRFCRVLRSHPPSDHWQPLSGSNRGARLQRAQLHH